MIRFGAILISAALTAAATLAQIPAEAPILSEFLCNQTGALETEWIELYNPTPLTLDLREYRIGDALGLRHISDTILYLYSGQYIILAQNIDRFLDYYSDYDGVIVSPVGWQTLNNYGGETVHLTGSNEETIDSVYYDAGFPYNRSWERYIDPEGESYWGGSFSPTGSTPGKPNTYFYPRPNSIDLTISPDPFSPDGDGFEDIAVIDYSPPEAATFELAVYDLSGRKVKTFLESSISMPGTIEWDGRDDNGDRLPIGIYIIYARVEDGASMETKRTVVIAR